MGRTVDLSGTDRKMIAARRFMKAGLLALMLLLMLMPAEASAAGISKRSATLLRGQSFTLFVKDTTRSVKWSSSKRSVARVNSAGVVKARKAGKAVITAKVGKKKYKCTVTVRQPVTRIALSKASVTIKKGKSKTIKATIKPGNAYKKAIKWKSSDSKIASVSKKGKVTAKAAGTAVITAKAKDGSGVTAVCLVTVRDPDNPIQLSASSMTLFQGEAKKLTVTGTQAEIVWASSNNAIATVAADGTVTGIASGKAKIMAMTKDGLWYAYCDVTVRDSAADPSAQAQRFLSILAKYSSYIQSAAAQGRYMAYSNSSALNRNTWAETVNDMNTKGIAYTNCAHLIRLALREMGKLGETQNFWGDNGSIHFNSGVQATLEQSCEIIKVNKSADQLFKEGGLIPGDICIWTTIQHTNVYAGNKLWYDAGRSNAGVSGIDGVNMKFADIVKGGAVQNDTLKADQNSDSDNKNGQFYIYKTFGPFGINLGGAKVAYIIRIVR